MQFLQLIALITISGAAATPVEAPNDERRQLAVASLPPTWIDDAPMCGYVRLHQDDGYIVGVYSHATCDLIYHNQVATLFRISEGGCGCKFYVSKQSCQDRDSVPENTGPNFNETEFTGIKPTYVLCKTI